MSRLTKKYDDDSGYTTIESTDGCGCGYNDINIYPYNDCVNKLGTLENLEEELGIDLITLFKALTEVNGIWYKDCGKIIKVIVLSISTMRENKFCLECYYDFKRFRVDTRDYKKTWWLKEDLENGDKCE